LIADAGACWFGIDRLSACVHGEKLIADDYELVSWLSLLADEIVSGFNIDS